MIFFYCCNVAQLANNTWNCQYLIPVYGKNLIVVKTAFLIYNRLSVKPIPVSSSSFSFDRIPMHDISQTDLNSIVAAARLRFSSAIGHCGGGGGGGGVKREMKCERLSKFLKRNRFQTAIYRQAMIYEI
jgi:hypothetical protein